MNRPTRKARQALGEIVSERVRFCLTFAQVRHAQILPVVSMSATEWKVRK